MQEVFTALKNLNMVKSYSKEKISAKHQRTNKIKYNKKEWKVLETPYHLKVRYRHPVGRTVSFFFFYLYAREAKTTIIKKKNQKTKTKKQNKDCCELAALQSG